MSVVFSYRDDDSVGSEEKRVLLEMGCEGGTLPSEVRATMSLVAEHAPGRGLKGLPEYAEFQEVQVEVLRPVRTLIEKLMILHNAALGNDDDYKRRTARHYYDVWCLLGDSGVCTDLTRYRAGRLADEVIARSMAMGRISPARPASGFADSLAFDAHANRLVAAQYSTVILDNLLWPEAERPSFAACCERVRENAAVLWSQTRREQPAAPILVGDQLSWTR